MVGAETANHLANHGKNVTIVEMLPTIAVDEQPVARLHLMQALAARNVVMDTGTAVKEIVESGILTVNGKESTIPADTIVLAVGAVSVNELTQSLQGKPYRVVTVGDAKEVRKVHQAVLEGFAAGLGID
jgi:NADH dehydrogenase FAD-containing subunit